MLLEFKFKPKFINSNTAYLVNHFNNYVLNIVYNDENYFNVCGGYCSSDDKLPSCPYNISSFRYIFFVDESYCDLYLLKLSDHELVHYLSITNDGALLDYEKYALIQYIPEYLQKVNRFRFYNDNKYFFLLLRFKMVLYVIIRNHHLKKARKAISIEKKKKKRQKVNSTHHQISNYELYIYRRSLRYCLYKSFKSIGVMFFPKLNSLNSNGLWLLNLKKKQLYHESQPLIKISLFKIFLRHNGVKFFLPFLLNLGLEPRYFFKKKVRKPRLRLSHEEINYYISNAFTLDEIFCEPTWVIPIFYLVEYFYLSYVEFFSFLTDIQGLVINRMQDYSKFSYMSPDLANFFFYINKNSFFKRKFLISRFSLKTDRFSPKVGLHVFWLANNNFFLYYLVKISSTTINFKLSLYFVPLIYNFFLLTIPVLNYKSRLTPPQNRMIGTQIISIKHLLLIVNFIRFISDRIFKFDIYSDINIFECSFEFFGYYSNHLPSYYFIVRFLVYQFNFKQRSYLICYGFIVSSVSKKSLNYYPLNFYTFSKKSFIKFKASRQRRFTRRPKFFRGVFDTPIHSKASLTVILNNRIDFLHLLYNKKFIFYPIVIKFYGFRPLSYKKSINVYSIILPIDISGLYVYLSMLFILNSRIQLLDCIGLKSKLKSHLSLIDYKLNFFFNDLCTELYFYIFSFTPLFNSYYYFMIKAYIVDNMISFFDDIFFLDKKHHEFYLLNFSFLNFSFFKFLSKNFSTSLYEPYSILLYLSKNCFFLCSTLISALEGVFYLGNFKSFNRAKLIYDFIVVTDNYLTVFRDNALEFITAHSDFWNSNTVISLTDSMFYFKIFTYKNSNLKNFFLWHVSSYFYRDIFKGVILLRETKPWVKIRGSERNFCLIYYTQVWYLNFFGTNKLKSLNLELFDKNKRHSSLSLIKIFYLKDWQAYLTCSYTWRFKTTSLYFNFLFSFIFRRRSYFINIMNSSLLNFNLWQKFYLKSASHSSALNLFRDKHFYCYKFILLLNLFDDHWAQFLTDYMLIKRINFVRQLEIDNVRYREEFKFIDYLKLKNLMRRDFIKNFLDYDYLLDDFHYNSWLTSRLNSYVFEGSYWTYWFSYSEWRHYRPPYV